MADKVKRAEVCGMEGQGATLTDAKDDARRKLAAFVARAKEGPAAFHVHGTLAMIWPDEFGWVSKVFFAEDARNGSIFGTTSGYTTREDAAAGVIFGAAQGVWSHAVPDDDLFCVHAFAVAPYWVSASERHRRTRELYVWTQWQRDYKRLRDLGATDGEAHEHAGRGDGWEPAKAAA